MTVLVVDGSTIIIDRWICLLSEMEKVKSVYGAVSYCSAVKILKRRPPDIILLDSGLPENETIALLKEIKETAPQVPVIVLSNRVDKQTEEQCKSNGADFFLDKYHEFEKVPGIINCIGEFEN